MSWLTIYKCGTPIPMRPDGSTECDHLEEEHNDDGSCPFDDCMEFTEGEPLEDDDEDLS
jgi:hypothetical protein